VPPNVRRFLPLILVAFFLLVLLPQLTHRGSSKGPTSKTLSQETISAMTMVDRAEVGFKAAHGHYTGQLADLLSLNHKLGPALGAGVNIVVDAGTDGQSYVGQVASNVIALVQARQGARTITKGCIVVKSSSGVACPAPPAKAGSARTTTGATTTTG
jgi:hypothetical protein